MHCTGKCQHRGQGKCGGNNTGKSSNLASHKTSPAMPPTIRPAGNAHWAETKSGGEPSSKLCRTPEGGSAAKSSKITEGRLRKSARLAVCPPGLFSNLVCTLFRLWYHYALLTPASAKVAIPLCVAKAARTSNVAVAAPLPSPRRMPRSMIGCLRRATARRKCPGSADMCEISQ